MKYGYKARVILFENKHDAVEEALNAEGAEGWRVIDMRWQVSSNNFVVATFEREIPEPVKTEGPVDATLSQV